MLGLEADFFLTLPQGCCHFTGIAGVNAPARKRYLAAMAAKVLGSFRQYQIIAVGALLNRHQHRRRLVIIPSDIPGQAALQCR